MSTYIDVTPTERDNRKRGLRISIAFHVLLVLLALIPLLTYPDPPPGQEGILVNLGIPDIGQGDDNAGPPPPPAEEAEDTPEEPVEEVTPPPAEPEPIEEVTPPDPQPEVVTTEDPEAIALRKREEQKRKEKERAERERREKERAEREAKERAEREKREAEAAAQAERDRREREAKKFGESLGLEGLGDGNGNTGQSGNQGDPDGDPNADRLSGVSTGSGSVGGGLGGRGVVNSPKVRDNSQRSGTVVVKVCVDGAGKVLNADFTQRGSRNASPELIKLAVANARKWKFSDGGPDKQCGTITYNFKVQ